MSQIISFFHVRQKQLFFAASLYIVFLILSHWQLPPTHVWVIAAFFSIIMNFTYLTEAYYRKEYFKSEAIISIILITASILGVVSSPFFVIAAIFAHGLWDLAKHKGMGVPFFTWYTLGCFTVDFIYSVALLIYWFSLG